MEGGTLRENLFRRVLGGRPPQEDHDSDDDDDDDDCCDYYYQCNLSSACYYHKYVVMLLVRAARLASVAPLGRRGASAAPRPGPRIAAASSAASDRAGGPGARRGRGPRAALQALSL